MKQVRFLLHYIKGHKWQYFGGILTLFVVDYLNLLIPQTTGVITDGLAGHTMGMQQVLQNLAKLLVVGLLIALGRFLWRYFLFGSARHIQYEMRNGMFRKLETMSVEYYNGHKTGDLMSRFTNDLNAVRMAIGMAVISAFDATVMALMVIGQMMYYVNVRLTLLAIIPMLFIAVGEFYYGGMMHKRFREKQEAVSDLTDQVQESISGIRVVKAFVQEEEEQKAFAKANAFAREKNLAVARLGAVVMPLLDVVIGVSSLITLLYGGYLAITGEITLGRFVAFNQYIGMLVWPMLAAGESITSLSQGLASAGRIREIFEADPEIRDDERAVSAEGIRGEITFEHLTFLHQGHTEPTLRDICLEIPAGTTLAIVGRTGNGKTTLVNLLLRLYNSGQGMIKIDGRDLNTIPLKELRESIAYVPQDNFLFSDTLRHNIAFGVEDEERGEADMAAVEAAARAACVHDNIIAFPDGYDTIVGERGVTLSGGQKQRSSIARALLKDAPILILDDALSAVDTDTEKQILQNLRKNRAGKTTILIAHRISTIQNADNIIVLENGEIRERGTHSELMEQNGIYHEMFEKQQLEAGLAEGEVTL